MASRASRYMAVEAASLDRRERPRLPVLVTDATARGDGEAPVAAGLCDLSVYGCRIRSEREHRPGDRVWLGLAGRPPVAASVVWSAGGLTGCRFDEDLSRATVRGLTLGIAPVAL